MYTMPITKGMACARSTIRASDKDSHAICKRLNGRKFAYAKKFVEGLVSEKGTVDGRKHHTGAARKLLGVLNTLEANARVNKLEPERMTLMISAHQGPNMKRGRRKSMFGMKMKITHIHAILKEMKDEGKAVRKGEHTAVQD